MLHISRTISHYLILVIAFLFPLFPKGIPPLIVLYFILWIVDGGYKGLGKIKFTYWAYLSAGFFLMHVLGMLYTNEVKMGMSELESKFSFLVLPIILLSKPQSYLGKIRSIMGAFIVGCFVGCSICLWNAFEAYMGSPELNQFMGSRLSFLIHLAYFALYLNACILFIFWLLNYGDIKEKSVRNLLLGMAAFFVLMILLSTSKSGLITLIINLIVIAYLYVKRTGNWIPIAVSTGAFVLFFGGMITQSQWAKDRMEDLIKNAMGVGSESGSTAIRLVAWDASWKVIKKQPVLGVGTGGVKSAIFEQYVMDGEHEAFQRRIGPHSQYLQTFAEIGIFGILLLLGVLFYPLYLGSKKKSITLFLFVLSFVAACASESIFQRQAGIVFFNFFLPILLVHINHLKFNDPILTAPQPS